MTAERDRLKMMIGMAKQTFDEIACLAANKPSVTPPSPDQPFMTKEQR